jgi:hypothetical protein
MADEGVRFLEVMMKQCLDVVKNFELLKQPFRTWNTEIPPSPYYETCTTSIVI